MTIKELTSQDVPEGDVALTLSRQDLTTILAACSIAAQTCHRDRTSLVMDLGYPLKSVPVRELGAQADILRDAEEQLALIHPLYGTGNKAVEALETAATNRVHE